MHPLSKRHQINVLFLIVISASRTCNLFEFLLLVINHYINGLHLFWDSFDWFCLQISSDAKYFFLLLSKALCWKINSCYSILFSNLKQKKNTELTIVELLAVTYILRHPVFKHWPHLNYIQDFGYFFLLFYSTSLFLFFFFSAHYSPLTWIFFFFLFNKENISPVRRK